MDARLNKLRGHPNGPRASAARLLDALELSLSERNAPLTPSSYFVGLLATLQVVCASDDGHPRQTHLDSVYLLSLIVDLVPPPVLRARRHDTLQLIVPSLGGVQPDRSLDVAHLRAVLAVVACLCRCWSSHDWQTEARVLLPPLLGLAVAHPPKLRRAAHGVLAGLLDHPEPEVSAGVAEWVASSAAQHLGALRAELRPGPRHQPAATVLISLVNFVQSVAHRIPAGQLTGVVRSLLTLFPHASHPFLATTVLDACAVILGPAVSLDQETLLFVLEHLLDLSPKEPASTVAWLRGLEHAYAALARHSAVLCCAELRKLGRNRLGALFGLFSSESACVRAALEALLVSISKTGLSDHDLSLVPARPSPSRVTDHGAQSPSSTASLLVELVYEGLTSNELISNGAIVELLQVFQALVSRWRTPPARCRTSGTPPSLDLGVFTPHLLVLDRLRAHHLGLRTAIDQTLAHFSQTHGPKSLLDVLPLNLLDPAATTSGRAWLLAVLRAFNTELGHFKHYFVPLSQSLFEKKRQCLGEIPKNARLNPDSSPSGKWMEIKIYDTLIEQIWKLLPGYCELPVDVPSAFDDSFTELLGQVIYSQAHLRPSVLNSLKTLVDRNLRLANQKAAHPDAHDYAEFGFDPQVHVDHLRKSAFNFVSVLFNVYNREGAGDAKKNANRGFMVDCIKSFLDILPEKDLSTLYAKVKDGLLQNITPSQPQRTKQLLEALVILLPKLVSSSMSTKAEINELVQLLFNTTHREQHLCKSYQELNTQKLYLQLLTEFIHCLVDQQKVDLVEDLDELIDQTVVIEKFGRIGAASQRARARLLSTSIDLIPDTKLHYIPKLLTEVVLGCKETNSGTRATSYETLVKIGRRFVNPEGKSKMDWKALVGDEEASADEQGVVDLEEFFKMLSAGLAGQSPHMISATISALSRALFEFHEQLKEDTITELIRTIQVFLTSSNREIAKPSIGFVKVAITILPKPIIERELESLVPDLLIWTQEYKNFFKTNLVNLFQRLIRKFGIGLIESYAPEHNLNGKRFLNGLKKKANQSKKKREKRMQGGERGEESELEEEGVPRAPRVQLQNAYEEVLYGGSDSESDTPQGKKHVQLAKQGRKNHKAKKSLMDSRILVKDEEDEAMDLLDGSARMVNEAVVGKLAKAGKKKQQSAALFTIDDQKGKLVITGEGAGVAEGGPLSNSALSDTNAYLEAISGEDGFRRDSKGKVKFNKRKHQNTNEAVDGVNNDLDELTLGDGEHQLGPSKKPKLKQKQTLGSEFKAKKAGGDLVKLSKNGRKDGVKPYGYLPLAKLGRKRSKSNQLSKKLNITGRR